MLNTTEFKSLQRIILANFKTPSFPVKFSYITTYRCNLKCQMCKIWKKQSDNELSCDEIERFFRKSNKFSWVGITGGEPFLRNDMTRIVQIVLENCKDLCVLHFATNGTLLERILNTVESIIGYKNSKAKILFSISIDGVKSEHDKIRGVAGSWDKSIQTYLKLKEIPRVEPRMCITLTNYNMGSFKDTFLSVKDIVPSLRFDDIGVNIFQKSTFYYENNDLPALDSRQAVSCIDKILRLDREQFSCNNFIRRLYLKSYKYVINQKRPLFNCQALSFNCVMDPNGNIYPCIIFNKMISNVKDFRYDLQSLWRSNQVKQLRKKCFYHDCPICWSPCDAYSSILCGLIKRLPHIIKFWFD